MMKRHTGVGKDTNRSLAGSRSFQRRGKTLSEDLDLVAGRGKLKVNLTMPTLAAKQG